MDLAPYVDELRDQLVRAAETGGADALALAERLGASLESAARLALLDALTAAAAEITLELAPGSVEVRLRGRDPEFVVQAAPSLEAAVPAPEADEPAVSIGEDAAITRINLRLPQELKDRVEDAARATGLSVNAWLVRAAAAAVSRGSSVPQPPSPVARGGQRYSGWVR